MPSVDLIQVKGLYDACPKGSLPAQDVFFKRLAADKFDPVYWASVCVQIGRGCTDRTVFVPTILQFCKESSQSYTPPLVLLRVGATTRLASR